MPPRPAGDVAMLPFDFDVDDLVLHRDVDEDETALDFDVDEDETALDFDVDDLATSTTSFSLHRDVDEDETALDFDVNIVMLMSNDHRSTIGFRRVGPRSISSRAIRIHRRTSAAPLSVRCVFR